ncbi:MAG: hypothetical protein K2W95_26060 [Candidatus Obscuribacterales bacterium]|nr:hypothetical protein [Candidatus Obscuribacterales bacterium]
MDLRCKQASQATLLLLGHERNKVNDKLVTLAAAMANRESKVLWFLLALISIMAVVLVIIGIAVNGVDSFLLARVAGRSGGYTMLWMVLIAVALTMSGFLIAIWYQRVRMRNLCEDLCENLPRCSEIPAQLQIIADSDKSPFNYMVSIHAQSKLVKVEGQRWYIMNSGNNIFGKPQDVETTDWLKQKNAVPTLLDGMLLVDSDGEPAAIVIENRVLWVVSTRFLRSMGLTRNEEATNTAMESKSQLRQLLRSMQ